MVQVGRHQYVFLLESRVGAFQRSDDIGRVHAAVFGGHGRGEDLLQIETRQRFLRVGQRQQFRKAVTGAGK